MAAEECHGNPRVASEITAFLAQQAAEKYLKGFLIQQEIEFPYTHNLVVLVNLAGEVDERLLELKNIAKDLTEYAVNTRYPGTGSEVSSEEARKAVAGARYVKEKVNELR